MKSRLLHTAASALAAALLLASCSGDSDSADDIDGIQTADDQPTDEASETPEPTPTDDGIDRPEIEVADDLDLVFEGDPTGDPVEDAVLADNEWQIKSVYAVLTTQDTESSAIDFYTQGAALDQEMDLVEGALDQGLASAGSMRFYNREVSLLDDGAALVSYCRDFTEVYTKDFETGEVVDPADADAPPTRYVVRLEENRTGVWQTVTKESEQESSEC